MADLLYSEMIKKFPANLQTGLAELLIVENPVMGLIPFRASGGEYTYNRYGTEAGATWVLPTTGTISDETVTFTQVTKSVAALVSQLPVAKKMAAIKGIEEARSQAFMATMRGIKKQFQEDFIQGSGNGTECFGLGKLCTDFTRTDVATSADNGQVLSLEYLDKLIDGMPLGVSALFMSKACLRDYKVLFRALNGSIDTVVRNGFTFWAYDGIPIVAMEAIVDNVTQGTSTTNTTSVYAVKWTEDESDVNGLCAIYGDTYNMGIENEIVGISQTQLFEIVRTTMWVDFEAHTKYAIGAAKGIIIA